MIIGQARHIVPEPWVGNRIDAPSLPMSAFARIPKDHSKNGSSLYLVREAHEALLNLLAAAQTDGIHLQIDSAYRSPGYQEKIFRKMMDEGRKFEDIVRYVAPPGYSEHALGTAVDFYPSNWRFAGSADYSWLQSHAATYGFSETYPRNNTLKYPWEAWHWTYHRHLDTTHQTATNQSASTELSE